MEERQEGGREGEWEEGKKEIQKAKETSKEKKQIKYPTLGDWLSTLYASIQWSIIGP